MPRGYVPDVGVCPLYNKLLMPLAMAAGFTQNEMVV